MWPITHHVRRTSSGSAGAWQSWTDALRFIADGDDGGARELYKRRAPRAAYLSDAPDPVLPPTDSDVSALLFFRVRERTADQGQESTYTGHQISRRDQ